MRGRWFAALVVVAVGLNIASSCDRKGLGDAPVGDRHEQPRDVILMPDKFANLAVVCDGPTRLYLTTRNAPPVLVEDHPACRGADYLDEPDG